jgi:hypothetical protein
VRAETARIYRAMRAGKIDDAHGKSLVYTLDVLGRMIIEQVNEKQLAELMEQESPEDDGE